jgi:hypothetical protein
MNLNGMQRKKFGLIAFIAILLLQISPVHINAWVLEAANLVPALLSSGATPIIPVSQADFNRDGQPEKISLMNGTATLVSASHTIWQSPESWQVTQAEITDLNGDKVPEATLLVWRPFHPWPVDEWLPSGGRIAAFHDVAGNSCHIIMITWQSHEYREMWAGSALAEPVSAFSVADLNNDGRQELITLEGTYTDPRSVSARLLKVWEWNGFGFSIVSKINGIFNKMALVQSGSGPILILVP